MKNICIALLFGFMSCSLFKKNDHNEVAKKEDLNILSNKIDSLETTADVIEFAKTVNPKFKSYRAGNMRIKSTDSIANDLNCNGIFKKWNVLNWEKKDLNNDGKTDLIFHAYWYNNYYPYAIMDMGSNVFKLFGFSTGSIDDCEFIKPFKIGNSNELHFLHSKSIPNNGFTDLPRVMQIDTLTYKFNDFIEINTGNKLRYDVISIEINTNGCFGDCPSYDLKINQDGQADFKGKSFMNFEGSSTKKIALSYFTELVKILEYIKVKELNNNYDVDWTDSQTTILKITFSDGSVKEIRDYGMQGTFGLRLIYSNLFKIASATNWE
ncbi:DUF6438 domain-containing protein [Flavobacterium sp. TR2]|uniref:DUF6438 domain-containing protein n=1 Tax=Flavobacterium sp. TR2 TaxID=2977321 RepID=UPI0021B13F63|nr:DUF6438 domain-containing protein [Flavobacterium sp. TR2]UWY28883.1 DUF6438 domain-containing protein [Flavobacterium sp. TR2]